MFLVVIVGVAVLYLLLPQLAGLGETWARIERGDPWWLALALACTIASFGGYVAVFRGVFAGRASRLDWRASYQITMAGLAASRLFGAGGAGGIALTAWALRRSGMARRDVADGCIAFLVLTYAVYVGAMVFAAIGLRTGVLSGPAPFAMTVVPAAVGLLAVLLTLSALVLPPDLERRLKHRCERGDRIGCWAERPAHVPSALRTGVRDALAHLRSANPALLGTLAFWGLQIAVLWAAFRAFGQSPTGGVLVLAFFVGMVGNLLPTPGGVGGVEGGMIGAFVALGVDAGLALVAVLVYRAFVFWLPTLPGTVAYFQLRATVARWHADAPSAPAITA
jgi:uncharacterized protein (TIRG00374 family)